MVVRRLEISRVDKQEGVQNTVLRFTCSDISLNVSWHRERLFQFTADVFSSVFELQVSKKKKKRGSSFIVTRHCTSAKVITEYILQEVLQSHFLIISKRL